jgi:hypothetical protein
MPPAAPERKEKGMKRFIPLLVSGALVASFAFVGPGFAGSGNKFGAADGTPEYSGACVDDAGHTVGTMYYDGPQYLWPPNHKGVNVALWATSTDSGDQASITGTATHDQITSDQQLDHNGDGEQDGSGNTPYLTDADPAAYSRSGTPSTGVQTIALRAERAGTDKTGRTYEIDGTATFTDSDTDGSVQDADATPLSAECDYDFYVIVPHDMRGGALWKQ